MLALATGGCPVRVTLALGQVFPLHSDCPVMGTILEVSRTERDKRHQPSIADFLEQVQREQPAELSVRGTGRDLGKASWLALVLETEMGYRNRAMKLERVHRGPADLAQLTITLEASSRGAVRASGS